MEAAGAALIAKVVSEYGILGLGWVLFLKAQVTIAKDRERIHKTQELLTTLLLKKDVADDPIVFTPDQTLLGDCGPGQDDSRHTRGNKNKTRVSWPLKRQR